MARYESGGPNKFFSGLGLRCGNIFGSIANSPTWHVFGACNTDATVPLYLWTPVVNKWLKTKYEDWKYEEEVRISATRDEADEKTGLYFVPFGSTLQLKEVIVGIRSSVKKEEVEKALAGYPEDVEILKAQAAHDKFKIIFDQY